MTREQLEAMHIRLMPGLTFEDYWQRVKDLDWENPLVLWQVKYRFDPRRFVREVFGVEPDPWQAKILDEVGFAERQHACRSGHGVGKTALVSWLNIWFICCFTPAKAVVTAPSGGTIEDGIGAEIALWMGRLPEHVQALFTVLTDRVMLNADVKNTWISMRTARPENPQTLAGIHAPHVMLTVDEASAFPDATFESASGSMTSAHSIMLLIGNPTKGDGYFHDCFHKVAHQWCLTHISCDDSPRSDPAYKEEIIARYGRESNQYRVRWEGNFPLANDDAVIPRWAVENTVGRDVAPLFVAPIWGLDVARSLNRDSSSLVKRKGNIILPTDPRWLGPQSRHTPAMMRWQFNDTAPLIGAVKREWDNTPESQRPSAICVDGIGFGATVADVLRSYGLPAIAVNVSERNATDDEYFNLKAELWFLARDWFVAATGSMPDDPRLVEELSTPEYWDTPAGQIIIEDKEAIRKRKQWSPDGADAFVLTFAATAAIAVPGNARALQANQPLRRNVGGLV